jgi:two-component system, NtrC family, response regulator HydG
MGMPPAPDADDLRTVKRLGLDLSTSPHASFVLVVVEGPDKDRTFSIDSATPSGALVGQGPACEIRLTDRQVSRRHCCLDVGGRRLRITDLGSTNGTFVDGVAIVEAWLRGGELVRVGGTAMRVDLETPPSDKKIPIVTGFGSVVGASLEMRRLYPLCQRLATSNVSVVIEGETGTGKEVLAESLHSQGPRASRPFIVFDCTAVPPNLVESELFGHERGAFTGAVAARKGVFEEADGGTLLIDEIGDLGEALQPKLLRAIERGEVRRVGSNRAVHVNVRVLAATRRDLDHEVLAGRFRDDLFHRLAVARIALPPLRRRNGDLPLLVSHFCRELGAEPTVIRQELLARWNDWSWPGNVRELRNAVARFLALGELGELDQHPSPQPRTEADDGEDTIAAVIAMGLPLQDARQRVVSDFERRYLQHVLSEHDGNVSRAAAASGVARRYFQILRTGKSRRKTGKPET